MNNPTVTVGIPVYNGAKYIELAVKSVLSQTYENFELIITDDGSTDSTLEILKQINDSRITVVADGENKGISYRLNQQIKMAKGKYFCRMDADDIMFQNRLERQVEYLEKHDDVDIVGSGAIIIDNENKIIGKRGCDINSSVEAVHVDSFIHPTVMARIDYFRKYWYDEGVSGAEDQDLWIRSRVDSSFMKLNEPYLFYRDEPGYKSSYVKRLYIVDTILRKHTKARLYPKFKYAHFLMRKYLQIFAAKLLTTLGKGHFLAKNRNQQLEKNEFEKYKSILLNLVD